MGRIRSIKPEILDDHKASKLSDAAWRLWVSTWVVADDKGRLPGDLDFLRARVFWGDASRTLDECSRALDECSRVGLMTVYEVEGERFVEISGFTRHQKIDKPSPPKFPGPEQGVIVDSTNVRLPFVESSANVRHGIGGDRKGYGWEGSAEGSVASLAAPPSALLETPAKPRKAKATKRPLPSDWQPSAAHHALAAELRQDCQAQAEKFRDHFAANGKSGVDWDAAFRNWLRRSQDFSQASPAAKQAHGAPARQVRSLDDYATEVQP